jgi:hypothetical protein
LVLGVVSHHRCGHYADAKASVEAKLGKNSGRAAAIDHSGGIRCSIFLSP